MNMKQLFFNFFRDFLKCGIAGWCIEILFTAMNSLRRRDMTLKGNTSLWMFPIYGSIAFLKPLFTLLKPLHFIIRGIIYAICIFFGEYVSGRWLTKRDICPWNYKKHKWHVNEVIRLDFLPCWAAAGLAYEHMLLQNHMH